MQIKLECKSITEYRCDVLVVNLFEKVMHPGGATGAIDKALGGVVAEMIASGEISGKLGETVLIHTYKKIPADKVICVGLGKNKEFDLDKIRIASASAIKAAKKAKAKKVATIIHGAGIGGIEPNIAVSAIVQGSMAADYEFIGYKSKKENGKAGIEELVIVDYDVEKIDKARSSVLKEQTIADSKSRVRDLVNGPSNMITPSAIAEHAKEIAREEKLDCEVLDRDGINKKGMKLISAVAQGSRQEPRVIILKYNGGGKGAYGLVGKGITFDSGGISIKPSKGMWEMKGDMAGAAAVLETMRAASKLKIKVNLIAVVPVTENMPGGDAYKPGDVIGSLSGKTVEIMSTDAEGRLVLADVITYAKQLGADTIIDLATLTGACRVALGDVAAGIMGNDQKLIDKLISLSRVSGERLWQLPLYEEYKEYIKSDIADIRNSTDNGGKAGTSSGGIFLKEFVEETPWAHIDIAGTAFLDRSFGYMDKGATGFGVGTLTQLFLELAR